MDTTAGFRLRHPLHPVNTAFKFQPGESTLSLNEYTALFHAAQFCLTEVHSLAPPAFRLGVHGIHPQQRTGKQSTLLSTHTASDLQNHIPMIVGISRKQQQCQLPFQPFTFRLGGSEFLLSQLPQIRVVEQFLRVLPGCLRRFPGVIGCHHRLQFFQLPGHIPEAHRISIDTGVRQLGLKVLIAQGDLL